MVSSNTNSQMPSAAYSIDSPSSGPGSAIRMASSEQEQMTTLVEPPNEIWKLIISYLENETLKTTRQVNSAFKDFATPLLFEHACLSLTAENLDNLVEMSKSEELSQHVKVLYLDLTTYTANMTPYRYAQYVSAHLERYSGLPPSGDTGPLSCRKLYKVLESNPAKELGAGYLSGSPRTALVAGYTQAMARVACFAEMARRTDIYGVVKDLLTRLKQIHTIASVSSWDFADDYPTRLNCYLRHKLPEKTFKQIPGLQDSPALHEDVNDIRGWFAPGVSAQFEITVATFRALKDSPHIRLKTLCLPGPDCISGTMSLSPAAAKRNINSPSNVLGGTPMSKSGFTSLLSLTSVPYAPDAHQDNLLLPAFKYLKVLELQIDFAHPGPRSIMGRFNTDGYRVPRALHTMRLVEKLDIGYCKPLELPNGFPTPSPVSLYDTMLYRDEDFEAEQAEQDDETPQVTPFPGGPNPNDFLNFLHSLISQALPEAAIASNPASNTSGQPNITASLAQSQAFQAPFHDSTTTNAGIGIGGPFYLPADPGSSDGLSEQRESLSDGPITPNPWPMLKSLSIRSMPAIKPDVLRLIKTIASTLRHLDMRNIRLNTSKAQPHSTTHSTATPTDVTPLHTGADSGTHGPIPGDPPGGPVDGDENSDLTKLAEEDQWYDTIETMADVLRLQYCTIVLGKVDKQRLVAKLEGQVDGFTKSGVNVNRVVANHLLHGEGMGLSLFAAGQVKEAMTRAERIRSMKVKKALLKAEEASEHLVVRQTSGHIQALEATGQGK